MITVAIADDHTLFRRGLRYLLEAQPDMDVIGEAADGESCLKMLEARRPSVLLMDIAMPGLDGISATKVIAGRWPEIQVVGLTMYENEHYFFRLLEAGASSYLLKGADPEDLLQAVRMAFKGETYLDPSLARLLVSDFLRQRRSHTLKVPNTLSDREAEVLRLIAAGRTGREIAGELTISPHTVERHRSKLMAKLGLHNKADLVRYAVRRGLVEPVGADWE
ncbi:MAG: response regulator transcription factor [Firmicutes bacterium]|nr:response regulator transcription factor [Bacillota bacterium]